MNKNILSFGLALALALPGAALLAKGRADKVEVDFNELKGMSDKKGRTLDGSVKFYFADEKAPSAGGEEISARGNKIGGGEDHERCKIALLQAFLSFQERAKRDEMTSVVGIRTFSDGSTFSKSRGKCLCVAGGVRAGTTVRGKLAK